MAWTDLSVGSVIDIKKSPNEEHIGTYCGSKQITTKIGEQTIWNFSSEEGNFGIYGFTNLNRVMEAVSVGMTLMIKYTGTQKVQTKYGLKGSNKIRFKRRASG